MHHVLREAQDDVAITFAELQELLNQPDANIRIGDVDLVGKKARIEVDNAGRRILIYAESAEGATFHIIINAGGIQFSGYTSFVESTVDFEALSANVILCAPEGGSGLIAAHLMLADQSISSPLYKDVDGNQVVGAQQTAVANATGAGDVVAQLNSLLAKLRTHGLIGT